MSNWIPNSDESIDVDVEISCIHVDKYSEKSVQSFVYIGTTEGDLYVISISILSGLIRICDYSVSTKDITLSSRMRITAILTVCFYEITVKDNET
jgi:hypothetical protein